MCGVFIDSDIYKINLETINMHFSIKYLRYCIFDRLYSYSLPIMIGLIRKDDKYLFITLKQ